MSGIKEMIKVKRSDFLPELNLSEVLLVFLHHISGALINKFVDLHDDGELKGLLIATAYGFFIMFSYYILRAVRDEISSADRGNLQLLWTAVFFVMLLAVPAYSWLASKFSRAVFVPMANRFFMAACCYSG
jgi:AAA family ATP:ADP antiporter